MVQILEERHQHQFDMLVVLIDTILVYIKLIPALHTHVFAQTRIHTHHERTVYNTEQVSERKRLDCMSLYIRSLSLS